MPDDAVQIVLDPHVAWAIGMITLALVACFLLLLIPIGGK